MGDIYTNADRIRAMTDEELAEFFTENSFYDPTRYLFCCPISTSCVVYGDVEDCRQCFFDWLKQECENVR